MKARLLGLLEKLSKMYMITFILFKIAKQYIKKYNPKIVGIVSNFTDTETAQAIFCILRGQSDSEKMNCQNSQLDLLLSLINIKARDRTILGWLALILKAKLGLIFKRYDYPPQIILDFSRVKFREMNQLLEFLSLNMVVLNNIQLGQSETAEEEAFGFIDLADKSPLSLSDKEKQHRIELRKKNKILSVLNSRGWAIVNIDDQEIFYLSQEAKAQIFSFSQKIEADIRSLEILDLDEINQSAVSTKFLKENTDKLVSKSIQSTGLSFKLIYKGSVVPIKLPNISEIEKISSILAGISVGILQGLDMVEIAERLELYVSEIGK